jgi:hypothetical protein
MVVTRADKTTVQALYRIRSAGQRLEIQMPETSVFDVKPLIEGRPVTLEVGQDRGYFVPLVDLDRDKSFLLELRYTYDSKGAVRPKWPVFPMKPAVQQVYLCVYLPEELDLVEKIGPWTVQFGWDLDSKGSFRPGRGTYHEYPDEASLLEWVAPNVELPETFPTDGRLYVFTALRPGSPTDAALGLMTIRRTWLNLIFCGVVLLVGAVLLPMHPKWKLFGAGSAAIILIVMGIFYPILTWHVCDAPLAGAIAVVLIVWLLRFVFGTLARVTQAKPDLPPSAPEESPFDRRPIDWKPPAEAHPLDARLAAEGIDVASVDDEQIDGPLDGPADDDTDDSDSTEGGKTDA